MNTLDWCNDRYRESDHRSRDYVKYIMKDRCGENLRHFAMWLKGVGESDGYRGINLANFALKFVQSFTYRTDKDTNGAHLDDWMRYTYETVLEQYGDCDDLAILLAGIFSQWCWDAILIRLNDPPHLAVGLYTGNLGEAYGTYYTFNNKRYFYCEAADRGWDVGDFPKQWKGEADRFYDVPMLCNKAPN